LNKDTLNNVFIFLIKINPLSLYYKNKGYDVQNK